MYCCSPDPLFTTHPHVFTSSCVHQLVLMCSSTRPHVFINASSFVHNASSCVHQHILMCSSTRPHVFTTPPYVFTTLLHVFIITSSCVHNTTSCVDNNSSCVHNASSCVHQHVLMDSSTRPHVFIKTSSCVHQHVLMCSSTLFLIQAESCFCFCDTRPAGENCLPWGEPQGEGSLHPYLNPTG